MKGSSRYQVHARKYQILSRGYAALKSELAVPARGAAKAYRQLASDVEQPPRSEPTERRAGRESVPSRILVTQ